jgi:hypothetical protein
MITKSCFLPHCLEITHPFTAYATQFFPKPTFPPITPPSWMMPCSVAHLNLSLSCMAIRVCSGVYVMCRTCNHGCRREKSGGRERIALLIHAVHIGTDFWVWWDVVCTIYAVCIKEASGIVSHVDISKDTEGWDGVRNGSDELFVGVVFKFLAGLFIGMLLLLSAGMQGLYGSSLDTETPMVAWG